MQAGGGDSGGGGRRIVVKSGAVVIVRLFVVVVIPPVKMTDIGKPGRLIFGRCRALVRDPDPFLPPSHLLPDNVAIVKRDIVVLVLVFVI